MKLEQNYVSVVRSELALQRDLPAPDSTFLPAYATRSTYSKYEHS